MRFLRRFYAAIIFGFLYLPIFVLIVFSFNGSKSRASWEGFTFRWYGALFEDGAILDALYYTVSIAVLAALLATIIGTLAAFAMYRGMRPWEKKIVMNLTYLPVLNRHFPHAALHLREAAFGLYVASLGAHRL